MRCWQWARKKCTGSVRSVRIGARVVHYCHNPNHAPEVQQ